MRNVLHKFLEKIKSRFTVNNFFFPENRTVYEIMSKNMVDPEGPKNDVIIWHIRVACWINKATRTHAREHAHTHSQTCTAYCFSTATIIRERTLILRYA
jgi:hypothetical protein